MPYLFFSLVSHAAIRWGREGKQYNCDDNDKKNQQQK